MSRPAAPASPPFGPLVSHGRFAYRGIARRPAYTWPGGAKLAVYVAVNLEHFAFGEGLGACLAPGGPQPDVLNFAWREYGNRVGAWRLRDLLDELHLPCAALINTALYDHCPDLVDAYAARGDEIVAHGHTNAERQGGLPEDEERALVEHCRDRIAVAHGARPSGWLSPWISESRVTPDLLQEAGYAYTLNWCHDDQPVPMHTRGGGTLWSVPYPQELNDIPAVVARQMGMPEFAQMIVDHADEMLEQTRRGDDAPALVMGIALHPYIVGQPHRLRHLRRALRHVADLAASGVWITTPGAIVRALPAAAAAV